MDDIISVLQQNMLRQYGHVLQKEHTDDWVKMEEADKGWLMIRIGVSG